MTHLRFVIVAAAVAIVAPAYAFTYETKSYAEPDGIPRYTDPDQKLEKFGNDKERTPQQNNGPVQFNFSVGPNDGFGRSNRFEPAWGPQAFPDRR
jgi:hypothetical protein